MLEAFGFSDSGLTSAEADSRLARYGENSIPESAPISFLTIFLRQFNNPLIYILALAGVVSLGIGEGGDAAFIFGVLTLNAVIGGFQEWRAERSSRALQGLVRTRATVIRGGEAREIDSERVVPGDAVWLESGSRIPADIRLTSAHGLEVDESLLTGESVPVQKDPDWVGSELASVGDRKNMAHAGSIVVRGRAKGVVVETGVRTLVGELALQVTATSGAKPPLIMRMERFTRVIAVAVLAAAVFIGLIGVFGKGHPASEMFMFAVALAVSAIPEGLPVALTVALAVATKRMADRGVIVRRLTAVEGLGSCTLVASDKTGTLTCNEITVRTVCAAGRVLTVSGEGYVPEGVVEEEGRGITLENTPALTDLAWAAALCNEGHLHQRDGAWTWRGDPTDVALLSFAHKLGIVREDILGRFQEINQIPFEPERKFAATYNRVEGAVRVFAKGAPERVLGMCELSLHQQEDQLRSAVELAGRGFRVLAFADGAAPDSIEQSGVPEEPVGLRFLGLVGMIDPLRTGVKEAVQACKSAGISVTMITGDHPVTALAIARDLGMATEASEVVSGLDIAQPTGEDLSKLVQTVRVFARVSPQQKLEIVDAARQAGHFVAVTGDGVNDAPALRAANIGVAMGKGGTDVAREAAELVLSDDNFATIVSGVEEGRVAYSNVRKVIYLLVSTGAAEVVMVALCLLSGLPLPLLPVQLLWLNLVTNGIQDVALAFEPKEAEVLERKPRPPTERIFDRLMIERTLIAAAVMGGVGFGTFHWLLASGWSEVSARNALLLLMVLFQNVHIGNCRSETRSLFRLSPFVSPVLLAGTLTAFLIHLGVMHFPLAQRVLQTEPVALDRWPLLLALALSVAVALEFHKLLWKLRRSEESVAT